MNPKVDKFLSQGIRWREEMESLRSIILECNLKEDFKWSWPCYTYNNRNIVLIHGFKDYCAVLFFKGVLLRDESKILIQQTANVQVGRQIRFTQKQEIFALEDILKAYILEAIEVEKAGLEVELKKTSDYSIPNEFKQKLESDPDLKKAFYELTPGRQRSYIYYFSEPKQAKTKEARIEKYVLHILNGKGLNDF